MQYIYNLEVNKYNIYSHAEERNKYILIAVYKIVMVTISYVNKPTQARPSYLSDLRTLYLYLYFLVDIYICRIVAYFTTNFLFIS